MADLARLAEALQRSGIDFLAGAGGAGGATPQETAEISHSAGPARVDFAGATAGAGGAGQRGGGPGGPGMAPAVAPANEGSETAENCHFLGGGPGGPAGPGTKNDSRSSMPVFVPLAPAGDLLTIRNALPAARQQQVSWADGSRRPLPGDWCGCCLGSTWWSHRNGERGWCCSTCHPPSGLGEASIVTVGTRNLFP